MIRPKPHVLIVEDDPDTLLLLRANLEASGFGTSLAADGGTALRRIAGERPDVVLLDLMLPGMDGWGVLAQVGSDQSAPPVVVCSAKDAPRDRTRASRMGAAAYVTKPFDLDGLTAILIAVCAERSDLERVLRRADPPVAEPHIELA